MRISHRISLLVISSLLLTASCVLRNLHVIEGFVRLCFSSTRLIKLRLFLVVMERAGAALLVLRAPCRGRPPQSPWSSRWRSDRVRQERPSRRVRLASRHTARGPGHTEHGSHAGLSQREQQAADHRPQTHSSGPTRPNSRKAQGMPDGKGLKASIFLAINVLATWEDRVKHANDLMPSGGGDARR